MMPVPPLPEWNPRDRTAHLKEECQQYYQAAMQYHYCAQGYLAHYPDLLAQLPDLPTALNAFTTEEPSQLTCQTYVLTLRRFITYTAKVT